MKFKKYTLVFKIRMGYKPSVRRVLVAALSSVYDPLGDPFLLKGWQIMQNLCKNNINCDKSTDGSSAYEWIKWRNNLMKLQVMNISRCIKPKTFVEVLGFTLNYFLYVCKTDYGMPAYIRFINANGQMHCSLLLGKSRVVPLMFLSIPRLELAAAVPSVRVSRMISEGRDVHIYHEIVWNNNQLVLDYISGNVWCFKSLVDNWVQQIRDQTERDQTSIIYME